MSECERARVWQMEAVVKSGQNEVFDGGEVQGAGGS